MLMMGPGSSLSQTPSGYQVIIWGTAAHEAHGFHFIGRKGDRQRPPQNYYQSSPATSPELVLIFQARKCWATPEDALRRRDSKLVEW